MGGSVVLLLELEVVILMTPQHRLVSVGCLVGEMEVVMPYVAEAVASMTFHSLQLSSSTSLQFTRNIILQLPVSAFPVKYKISLEIKSGLLAAETAFNLLSRHSYMKGNLF